jgi:hypothetical protein
MNAFPLTRRLQTAKMERRTRRRWALARERSQVLRLRMLRCTTASRGELTNMVEEDGTLQGVQL